MPITALYAALLSVVVIYLAFRVIDARRSERVSRGDGGNAVVALRRGTHSNTFEYGLIMVVLLGLSESLDAPGWLLHILALAFVAGRSFYILAARGDKENFKLRVRGMVLTFYSIAATALLTLVLAFAPGFVCCRLPL